MHTETDVVEKWIEMLAESHPQGASALRASCPDRFRNPVGYSIRTGLAQLWEELQGNMNADVIDSALDTVLRIRAVQDISPDEAVGFVTQLRSILCELPATFDLRLLENRIDQLTLAAFDKYAQCRAQIHAAGLHETERLARTRCATGKAGA